MAAVIAGGDRRDPPGSATAKGVSLAVTIDPDAQVIVTGDSDRLRQVAWNLLSNAVKFTPRGGRVRGGTQARAVTGRPGGQ